MNAAATKAPKDKTSDQVQTSVHERPRQIAMSDRHNNILALQRTAGNHAVNQLMQPEKGETSPDKALKPLLNASASIFDEKGLPSSVCSVLSGTGQPLTPSIRDWMEPRFREDFGTVRVHTGSNADKSAAGLSTVAYTIGEDIVFSTGRYQPHTPKGRWLLAHELAHVVQQRRARATTPGISERNDPFERTAHAAAGRAFEASQTNHNNSAACPVSIPSVSSAPPVIQALRSEEELDAFKASLIEIFHVHQPVSEDGFFSRTDVLLSSARGLHETFKDSASGPQTRLAAARALLKIYGALREREETAARDTDGALLYDDDFRGPLPWTPDRPRHLNEIPPFSLENFEQWSTTTVEWTQQQGTSNELQKGIRSGRRKDRQKQSVPESKESIGEGSLSRVAKIAEGETAYRIYLLKTSGMSLRTTEGKANIIAKVILSLTPSKPVKIAFDTAKAVAEAAEGMMMPPPGKTVEEWKEDFEAKDLGDIFAMDFGREFFSLLSEYTYVPSEYRLGLEPSDPSLYPGQRKNKQRAEGQVWKPLFAEFSVEERLQWALARLRAQGKGAGAGHLVPGRIYENGLMFITHASNTVDQIYLTPDGRLYQVNERELLVEAFRGGVVRAAGAVILAYGMVAAGVVLATSPGLLTRVAVSLEGLAGLTAADIRIMILANPAKVLALAEFGLGTAIQIGDQGVDGFIESLQTPEGAADFLMDLLNLKAASGSRSAPVEDVDPDLSAAGISQRERVTRSSRSNVPSSTSTPPEPPPALAAPLKPAAEMTLPELRSQAKVNRDVGLELWTRYKAMAKTKEGRVELARLSKAGDEGAAAALREQPEPNTYLQRRDIRRHNIPIDPEVQGELSRSVKEQRAKLKSQGTPRIDPAPVHRMKTKGGTVGAIKTDIQRVEEIRESGSPLAKPSVSETKRELKQSVAVREPLVKSPSENPQFRDHAEEIGLDETAHNLTNQLKTKQLTRDDLNGKTVSMHVETEVCRVCRQGLDNPNVKPGVLKQFSELFPELTIRVTASGTKEVLVIRGGKYVDLQSPRKNNGQE